MATDHICERRIAKLFEKPSSLILMEILIWREPFLQAILPAADIMQKTAYPKKLDVKIRTCITQL